MPSPAANFRASSFSNSRMATSSSAACLDWPRARYDASRPRVSYLLSALLDSCVASAREFIAARKYTPSSLVSWATIFWINVRLFMTTGGNTTESLARAKHQIHCIATLPILLAAKAPRLCNGRLACLFYARSVMKKLGIGCAIIAALGVIVLILVIIAGGSYNRLVKLSQGVDASWAQVQNVYQRRADLIPNLVATVSGAANFEKSTLTEITAARASVGKVQINAAGTPNAAQLAQFDQAQGALGSALSRLLVVAENYPSLKATANFQELQAQLEGTENRISVERGRFNELARDYNSAIKRVPAALFAGMMGFHEKPYFAAKPGSDTPPPVSFDFNKKP